MKSHLRRRLSVVALSASLLLLTNHPASAATRVRIPGGPDLLVVQISFAKGRLLLRTEDNRTFTVPLDTPGLEIFLDGGPGKASPATSIVPGSILTLQDIIKMLQEGTSEEVLAAFIEQSQTRYILSKGSLADLKQAGASDTFIQFVLRAGRGSDMPLGRQGDAQQQGQAQLQPEPEEQGTLAPYPVSPTDYNMPLGGFPFDGAYYGGGYSYYPGYSYPIGDPIGGGFGGYYPPANCPVPCYNCAPGTGGGRGGWRGRDRRGQAPTVTARPASAGVNVTNGALTAGISASTGSRMNRRGPVQGSASNSVMGAPRAGVRTNNMPLGIGMRTAPGSFAAPATTMVPSMSAPQSVGPRPAMGMGIRAGTMAPGGMRVRVLGPGAGPAAGSVRGAGRVAPGVSAGPGVTRGGTAVAAPGASAPAPGTAPPAATKGAGRQGPPRGRAAQQQR